MSKSKLITSREACDLLGISRGTLTYWILKGKVEPAQTLAGPAGAASQHLWDRAEVAALALTREAF